MISKNIPRTKYRAEITRYEEDEQQEKKELSSHSRRGRLLASFVNTFPCGQVPLVAMYNQCAGKPFSLCTHPNRQSLASLLLRTSPTSNHKTGIGLSSCILKRISVSYQQDWHSKLVYVLYFHLHFCHYNYIFSIGGSSRVQERL